MLQCLLGNSTINNRNPAPNRRPILINARFQFKRVLRVEQPPIHLIDLLLRFQARNLPKMLQYIL